MVDYTFQTDSSCQRREIPMRFNAGVPGADGKDGKDGFSPTVLVERI
jgi:hypothetical protein